MKESKAVEMLGDFSIVADHNGFLPFKVLGKGLLADTLRAAMKNCGVDPSRIDKTMIRVICLSALLLQPDPDEAAASDVDARVQRLESDLLTCQGLIRQMEEAAAARELAHQAALTKLLEQVEALSVQVKSLQGLSAKALAASRKDAAPAPAAAPSPAKEAAPAPAPAPAEGEGK